MEVAKMRNVLLIAAGLFGGMWVFQIYTAFLPEFFRTYRGMTLSASVADDAGAAVHRPVRGARRRNRHRDDADCASRSRGRWRSRR